MYAFKRFMKMMDSSAKTLHACVRTRHYEKITGTLDKMTLPEGTMLMVNECEKYDRAVSHLSLSDAGPCDGLSSKQRFARRCQKAGACRPYHSAEKRIIRCSSAYQSHRNFRFPDSQSSIRPFLYLGRECAAMVRADPRIGLRNHLCNLRQRTHIPQ